MSGGEQQMLAMSPGARRRPRRPAARRDLHGPGAADRAASCTSWSASSPQEGISILLVEQFARTALAVSDYAAVMTQGRIAMVGQPGRRRRLRQRGLPGRCRMTPTPFTAALLVGSGCRARLRSACPSRPRRPPRRSRAPARVVLAVGQRPGGAGADRRPGAGRCGRSISGTAGCEGVVPETVSPLRNGSGRVRPVLRRLARHPRRQPRQHDHRGRRPAARLPR